MEPMNQDAAFIPTYSESYYRRAIDKALKQIERQEKIEQASQ